jgi:hypothetical protein
MLNGQPDLARLLEEQRLTTFKSLFIFVLYSFPSRLTPYEVSFLSFVVGGVAYPFKSQADLFDDQ